METAIGQWKGNLGDFAMLAVQAAGSDDAPGTAEAIVATAPLLLLEEGHCLRDQALAVCAKDKERRLVNFGATSMTTLLQLVSNGLGLTLLPEIAIPVETAHLHSLTITPFAEPMPHRDIALFWRKSSRRLPDFGALAGAITEVAGEILPEAEAA